MKQRRDEANRVAAEESSPSIEDENAAAILQLKRDRSVELSEGLPPAKRQKVSREQSIDDFKSQMKAISEAARSITDIEDPVQLGSGERGQWRGRYYKTKFHLTETDVLSTSIKHNCILSVCMAAF